MSQFDTDFAATSAVDLFGVLGRTVTYEGASITAIFRRLTEAEIDSDRGQQTDEMGELKVKTSDVVDPATSHTVVIGSDTWSVTSIDEVVGGVVTLTVRRLTAKERTRRSYRNAI